MLTFRNTNILFGAVMVLLIIASFYIHIPWFFFLVALFLYSMFLFLGSYFIQHGFYFKSICSAQTTKKQIAFTFDDGPAKNYTPEILKALKENNVQAAFFCIGNRISGNENLLAQIKNENHIIGNHSYSHHFWFDLFSSRKMLNDIQLMNSVVKETVGLTPKLFRPPYGVTNPNLKKAIDKGNYISIGWNIRSMDTVAKDANKLMQKIKSSLKPGAIILFHDNCKITVDILPEFIRYVKAEGYEIIRLDKMCNLQAYE
ncbi:MAG TPA: polysaccharide deacetylase family protein [Puia sp.]|nr:polysaccharide deacetylase family protein [Puia sp.]